MLRRKCLLGASTQDIITCWSNPKTVRTVFGMGQGEANAVINLAMHIPEACADMLAKAVERHGIVKGPFTHSAIGSDAFRV